MKNSTIKSFILLALLLIPATLLYAIPAYPYPVTFTQPNGDTLTVRVKGDEKINWFESMDEYTLLLNKAGYLSYAQLDEKGDLQPTEYFATDIEQRDVATLLFLKNIKKNLFYSESQVDILLQVWQMEEDMILQDGSKDDRAVSGKRKGIVALIGFSDKPFSKSLEEFDNLLNQVGYIGTDGNGNGSARDYFKEVSYGTLDFSFTVFGPYTAQLPLTSYEDANSNGHANIRNMVRWVLNEKIIKDAKVDFRDYDLDNNKVLDGFHFIFAGRGAEAGAKSIWSHAGYLSPAVVNNSVTLTRYSCSPELTLDNSQTGKKVINTIGVVCHEMTHCLGAADFYDTDYKESGGEYPGCGDWCLMSSGCYNGTTISGVSGTSGNTPSHQNIFIKIQFGWVKPIVIGSPGYVDGMPNSAENQFAFRINTKTDKEYYLLENRQQVGFDSKVPGKGLLVYHVHKDVNQNLPGNCVNCKHPQQMYVVAAGRTTQMPNATVSSYGAINNANCTFPNGGKTSFTDDTTPAMLSWANEPTGKPITNITNQNGVIGFDFMGGGDINLGISEYEKTLGANSIQIVPNPANDYFELRITNYESQIHNIDIFNALGQLVKSVPFQAEPNNGFSSQKISITDLNKGFYFVKAGNASAKLIISAY